MKKGTILKNLWAGYETYFIYMGFPVRVGRMEASKVGGYSLSKIDGKWHFERSQYYNQHLSVGQKGKQMADNKHLIYKEDLIAEYDRVHIGPPGGARKLMEDAHAVEAVEVVHGRWLFDSNTERCFCSACNEEALYTSKDDPIFDYDWEENLRYSHTETILEEHLTKYCPNCGAKMDAEKRVSKSCIDCENDGLDMPQCKHCNPGNDFAYFTRKKV